jgi:hypothetical protein
VAEKRGKWVIALRQDPRLCCESETVESNELRVICSLGLRSAQE